MNRLKVISAALTSLAILLVAHPVAAAEAPHVATVVVFDSSADMAKLADTIKKLIAVEKKLGSPGSTRVWGGVFGGDGSTVIVTEYPSQLAMAQYMTKRDASPEWSKFLEEAGATGIKRPQMSLVADETP